MKKAGIILLLVLTADQTLKIWIKTNMYLGQEYRIFDWFIIHFTENNGMAFGLQWGGEFGKLLLTVFRLVAVSVLIYFLLKFIKEKKPELLITCTSFVLAGALGNIIDSTFYGHLFSSSEFQVATFDPDNGYSSFLHGKVVDMFYFPIIQTILPEWIPFWGGQDFIFFRPVFNIADASISCGIITGLIFQKKLFPDDEKSSSTTAGIDQQLDSDYSEESHSLPDESNGSA